MSRDRYLGVARNHRGRRDDQDVDQLMAAGLAKIHTLEVIAAVAASTITNSTGSVTKRLSTRRSRLTPGGLKDAESRQTRWMPPPARPQKTRGRSA